MKLVIKTSWLIHGSLLDPRPIYCPLFFIGNQGFSNIQFPINPSLCRSIFRWILNPTSSAFVPETRVPQVNKTPTVPPTFYVYSLVFTVFSCVYSFRSRDGRYLSLFRNTFSTINQTLYILLSTLKLLYLPPLPLFLSPTRSVFLTVLGSVSLHHGPCSSAQTDSVSSGHSRIRSFSLTRVWPSQLILMFTGFRTGIKDIKSRHKGSTCVPFPPNLFKPLSRSVIMWSHGN